MIPAHANGVSRRPTPEELAHPSRREPLDAVLELGRRASRGIGIGLCVAILFHGTAAARAAAMPMDFMRWSRDVGQQVHDRLFSVYDIEVAKAPPEPEPQAKPPEPVKEEPKAELPPPPPPSRAPPKEQAPPPAPAAAQAGAVLTKAADPDEPVDLTGFVTGNAAVYAGGVTEQGGTSASAVYERGARAAGVPGGHGTAVAPPPPLTPDRSKPAGLSGSSEWKCPWPSEADAEQIDEAYVSVQVATRPDGTAERVTILSDPGHGFAREARQCAMRERYNAALDHDGNAIGGLTKAFRIHFER